MKAPKKIQVQLSKSYKTTEANEVKLKNYLIKCSKKLIS
jgi:hypothetical protein